MPEVHLDVGGMHCASCVANVESALAKLPHAANVRVNLATERATVEIPDSKMFSPDELISAVARAGN